MLSSLNSILEVIQKYRNETHPSLFSLSSLRPPLFTNFIPFKGEGFVTSPPSSEIKLRRDPNKLPVPFPVEFERMNSTIDTTDYLLQIMQWISSNTPQSSKYFIKDAKEYYTLLRNKSPNATEKKRISELAINVNKDPGINKIYSDLAFAIYISQAIIYPYIPNLPSRQELDLILTGNTDFTEKEENKAAICQGYAHFTQDKNCDAFIKNTTQTLSSHVKKYNQDEKNFIADLLDKYFTSATLFASTQSMLSILKSETVEQDPPPQESAVSIFFKTLANVIFAGFYLLVVFFIAMVVANDMIVLPVPYRVIGFIMTALLCLFPPFTLVFISYYGLRAAYAASMNFILAPKDATPLPYFPRIFAILPISTALYESSIAQVLTYPFTFPKTERSEARLVGVTKDYIKKLENSFSSLDKYKQVFAQSGAGQTINTALLSIINMNRRTPIKSVEEFMKLPTEMPVIVPVPVPAPGPAPSSLPSTT